MSQENDVRERGPQNEPILSSISNASDQVTNDALGESSQLATSSNQKNTGIDSKVAKINELSLYSEDNAPLKQKFIPEEPLPLQRELATIRVPCEEEYARVAERFKVVDCAVTQTKKGAAEFQQYLTDERTNLPPATTSTVRGMTEPSNDPLGADSDDVMMEITTEKNRKRKIDEEGHVEQKRSRPLPHEPVPWGTFMIFLHASRPGLTPSTGDVQAALMNLGLFRESPENTIPTARPFSTAQSIWCVRFTTKGDITDSIASLLNDTEYSQKMNFMNCKAFGVKVEEYVYISKDAFENTKSITTFFILMHRTLRDLVYFVQGEQLVMRDGTRLSIKEVVAKYGQESKEAYKVINGRTKARLKFIAKRKGFSWKTTNVEHRVVIGSVELATIQKIDDLVAKLEGVETQSVLKTLFTKNIAEMLKNRRTSLGGTLFDCVRAGVRNNSSIGIYAPDAEAYSVFAPFFDNVVHDLHGFSIEQVHPPCNMIHVGAMVFPPVDPRGQFVKSTKISCRRSLNGFPFASRMTKEKYLELECKVKEGFEASTGTPMEGVYHSLESLNKEQYKKMIIDKNLFRRGAEMQEAHALRHWPTGRGVFMNTSGDFLVCVNEQDHLRMESSENGSDIGSAYNRLIEGVQALENKLEFSRNDRLGFVTFCPTDLGSTIEATVSIRLPKLSVRTDFLQRCDELGLKVRSIEGSHWNRTPGALLLTNKSRLGMSEYDAIRTFHTAVKRLIELERKTD